MRGEGGEGKRRVDGGPGLLWERGERMKVDAGLGVRGAHQSCYQCC